MQPTPYCFKMKMHIPPILATYSKAFLKIVKSYSKIKKTHSKTLINTKKNINQSNFPIFLFYLEHKQK